MHGHERPVERKIRLWVSRLEAERRNERQPGRGEPPGDGRDVRRQHGVDAGAHEQRQGP
jgi:hypothetical protein